MAFELHGGCEGPRLGGPRRPTGKAAKPVTILFASSGASCLSWQLAEFARVSPASPPPVLASATCRYLWCVAPHIVYYNMRVYAMRALYAAAAGGRGCLTICWSLRFSNVSVKKIFV